MEEQTVRQEGEEEEEEGVGKSKGVDVDLGGGGGKAARLPRWTRQEILVLIQGKRVAESRVRRGRSAVMMESSSSEVVVQVEPKWATVSSYCKRHGVNRGPVQCRKRWSNLAGDYKKIKEWEANIKDESESFWLMRNDFRRERKLPGFFDKEVFDILNNNNNNNSNSNNNNNMNVDNNNNNNNEDDTTTNTPQGGDYGGGGVKGEGVVFDSGRSAAADDGLFSDFEASAQRRPHHEEENEVVVEVEGGDDQVGEGEGEGEGEPNTPIPTPIPAPTPISEKQYQPMTAEATTGPGANQEKQGRKRRRFTTEEDDGDGGQLQDELVQVLEKNGRIISSQLDAYNINMKLDREERKDHATSLVAVLNKLADSLGRIADKL